jgi:pimeloyl-ACP methyl ester carboxylesterase
VTRKQLLIGILTTGLASALALCLSVIIKAAIFEHRVDFTPVHDASGAAELPDLEGARLVTFPGYDDLPATGVFLPARNDRFVVFVHGAGADRRQLLEEAAILGRRGYGFLTVDLPGHGGSQGPIRWGEPEKQLVKQALAWARSQSSDCTAFGLYGFSMGSWMALWAAAEVEEVRALALSGCFADARDVFWAQSGRWGVLSYLGTIAEARRMGYRYDEHPPAELIAAYSPRPVLFVVGSEDGIAPPASCRALHDAATGEKRWLVLEGAGHGDYLGTRREVFQSSLLEFFERHLAPPTSRCKLAPGE